MHTRAHTHRHVYIYTYTLIIIKIAPIWRRPLQGSWHNLRYFLGSCLMRLWRISPQFESYLFLSSFAKLQAAVSIVMSVCLSVRPSAWNSSATTGRILIKFDIWVLYENLSRKFKFHSNPRRITSTLHEGISGMIKHIINNVQKKN